MSGQQGATDLKKLTQQSLAAGYVFIGPEIPHETEV
jgi:hypothetical protein